MHPYPVTGSTHATAAWLLSGLSNTPGILSLHGDRLRFAGRQGVLFDESLATIEDIRFPWYEASGGFRATIGGIRRRISLTRPNGAELPAAWLIGHGTELVAAGIAVHSIVEGRRNGKAWRQVLGA